MKNCIIIIAKKDIDPHKPDHNFTSHNKISILIYQAASNRVTLAAPPTTCPGLTTVARSSSSASPSTPSSWPLATLSWTTSHWTLRGQSIPCSRRYRSRRCVRNIRTGSLLVRLNSHFQWFFGRIYASGTKIHKREIYDATFSSLQSSENIL